MDLVKAVSEAEDETEDFSNLVVANVSDFVYVRTEPSEEAGVAGKLYKDSVGEALEESDNGWIKIKSGNTEGYVSLEFVFTGEEAVAKAKEVGQRSARVTTTTLYVRKDPNTDAEVVGLVPMDDVLTVEEETNDEWVKVSIEEGDGYVSTDYVKLYTEFVHAESKAEEEARLKREEEERRAAAEAAARAAAKNKKNNNNGKKNGGSGKTGSSGGGGGYVASGSGNGASVANYALQFVGNPYVYGGSSLTNGTDCSGFVMSVYRNFGISLPHSSGADRGVGYGVSGGLANAQAGDIVCYSGHVGIYIGGGQIVHASTARTGIKVSNANYRTPVAVRRIF
ncbi:MAG: C40 family peptidase [Lachnospiraceae bacterium]|nr:C40 family peptidase [Lachnospiraceae bacterium]